MGFRVGFNTQPPEGGWLHQQSQDSDRSSFNTQPPEGGWMASALRSSTSSCFNTQPPEGGWAHGGYTFSDSHGFNTQPPEGGWTAHMVQEDTSEMFQHTAARRRLGYRPVSKISRLPVSTHSRPKAAGELWQRLRVLETVFQHTAARRRLEK